MTYIQQDFSPSEEDRQIINEIFLLLKKRDESMTVKYAQNLLHYCAEDLPYLISIKNSEIFQYTE